MIPDNVEKIIMTKEDYDRNVEQLLLEKINAEQEIERLNKELEKYKYTADELNEIERLNNIIKEVREYIEKNIEYTEQKLDFDNMKTYNCALIELQKILDKGE